MTDATPVRRPGELAWFEIHVDDMARAEAFYRAVFGWSFVPLTGFPLGAYQMIMTAAGTPANGGLAQAEGGPRPGVESSVLYLYVDDIGAGVDAALATGGTLHRDKMDIGGAHGFCAIVRDPSGNLVGLWSDH